MINEKLIQEAWNRARFDVVMSPLKFFTFGFKSGFFSGHKILVKKLQEKQKIIDEQLEIIKFYARIENYSHRIVGTTSYATKIKDDIEVTYDTGYKLLVSGKKAREYVYRIEAVE